MKSSIKPSGKIRALLASHGIHVPNTKRLSGWHYREYRQLKGKRKGGKY